MQLDKIAIPWCHVLKRKEKCAIIYHLFWGRHGYDRKYALDRTGTHKKAAASAG
jgi:GH15 family glucan-1,4-alpha-glucosidase